MSKRTKYSDGKEDMAVTMMLTFGICFLIFIGLEIWQHFNP